MSTPSLEDQILSQIEFYFSASNLRRDKFMKTTIANDPDHAVPLATLMTFNRLKKLSEDKEVILAAIKKSEVLTILADGEKIQGKDIPSQNENLASSCVHLRGLPTSSTLDDILNGLKEYGDIQYIEMRRYKNHEFKGVVNVEFKSQEEAEAFIAKTIMFAGVELTDKKLLSVHNEEKKKTNAKFAYCSNSLLQLKIDDSITKEDILKVLEPYQWEFFYLDYKQGAKNCVARLQNSEICEQAKKDLIGKTINDKKIKPFILRGKQAVGSWSKIKASMMAEEHKPVEPAEPTETTETAPIKRTAEEVEDNKKPKEESN